MIVDATKTLRACMDLTPSEIEIQRQYYSSMAHDYDAKHLGESSEHLFALNFLLAVLDFLNIRSLLDIGSGTGRALSYIKDKAPGVRLLGVEPVTELREIGYAKGLSRSELFEGDGYRLEFEDGQIDLVCEFGVLHHVRNPEQVVAEMLRVAKKAIFISDSNNFGQGSPMLRMLKQTINAVGLWRVADFIKTKGKGYLVSEGDGLAYSYSVFNNYTQIRQQCSRVHLFNTIDGHIDPYRTASHVALLGIKR